MSLSEFYAETLKRYKMVLTIDLRSQKKKKKHINEQRQQQKQKQTKEQQSPIKKDLKIHKEH